MRAEVATSVLHVAPVLCFVPKGGLAVDPADLLAAGYGHRHLQPQATCENENRSCSTAKADIVAGCPQEPQQAAALSGGHDNS